MIDKVMSLDAQFDLLVVDDNSPDGTAELVRARRQQYAGRVHLLERSGKLGLGTAYIAGFRWAAERRYDRIFEMDCDATAGFVGYTRRVLETIDFDRIRMNGYGFQIEMKYSAWRLGFAIREVSIIFIDRTEGTSKMSGGIFSEALFGVVKLPFRRIRPKQTDR